MFGLTALAAVLAGLGGLTRYAFGWVIVPVITFIILFGGPRNSRLAGLASLALLVFGLAFVILFAVVAIVLHLSGFGRLVYVMGNNLQAARYSGIRVRRVKMSLFVASGVNAALAGLLYAARLGSVRGDMAQGFELDIISIVLLGGVSIFGGSGNLAGVGLSILVILNLRNGMGLANITGNTQTCVIGALLILSVLVPNIVQTIRNRLKGSET